MTRAFFVLSGTYEPITDRYSIELRNLVWLLIQRKPENRPDADEILCSALAQRFFGQLMNPNKKAAENACKISELLIENRKLEFRLNDAITVKQSENDLKSRIIALQNACLTNSKKHQGQLNKLLILVALLLAIIVHLLLHVK